MIGKLALASLLPALAFGQYTATYDANNLPATTEEGQAGTNKCGTGSSQDSLCQNAYMNSLEDFCLFAPSSTTSAYGDSSLGNTEREVVSWCLKSGYGTRLIPTGAITGAHFVKTPTYLQFSGTLAVRNGPSLLNIPQNDAGGELDPHGADGLGNPIGGLVFTSAFGGGLKQIHEWNSFIGAGYFCFKVCDEVEGAPLQCQHIYDVLGCGFNMPGDYSENSYSSCDGDVIEPPGVYGASTFYQGQEPTPAPHAPAATSNCRYINGLPYGGAAAGPTAAVAAASSSGSASSAAASASGSASSAAASSSGSASSAAASSSSSSSSGAASSSSTFSSSRASSSVAAASQAPSSFITSSAGPASSTGKSASTQGVVASASATASSTGGAAQNTVGVLSLALAGVVGVAFSML